MSIARLEILEKIKELLQKKPKNKSIAVDTLQLIYNIPAADLMIKLLALEEEGHIKLVKPVLPKQIPGKYIIMIELSD